MVTKFCVPLKEIRPWKNVAIRKPARIFFWMVLIWLYLPLPAQSAAVKAKIAILSSAEIPPYQEALEGFKTSLPKTFTFFEYQMKGSVIEGRNFAKKIRALNVDLVLAIGLKAALVAKLEIIDIPVVFCMVLDIKNNGLQVPNMAGIMLQVPIGKQFMAMRGVLPNLRSIGILYNPSTMTSHIEEAKKEAEKLGIEIVPRAVTSEKDVPQAARKLIPFIDAFWLLPDRTILSENSLRFLLGTALDHYVPVYGYDVEFVRSGALVGLYVKYQETGSQAGEVAKGILDGETHWVGLLVPPTNLHLALNLQIARFLDITIPEDIRNQSDIQF